MKKMLSWKHCFSHFQQKENIMSNRITNLKFQGFWVYFCSVISIFCYLPQKWSTAAKKQLLMQKWNISLLELGSRYSLSYKGKYFFIVRESHCIFSFVRIVLGYDSLNSSDYLSVNFFVKSVFIRKVEKFHVPNMKSSMWHILPK